VRRSRLPERELNMRQGHEIELDKVEKWFDGFKPSTQNVDHWENIRGRVAEFTTRFFNKKRNLTQEIRDWIETLEPGTNFTNRQCDEGVKTRRLQGFAKQLGEWIENGCIEDKEQIIVLNRYVSKLLRSTVHERDGHRCLKCGTTKELTIDHIYPLCRGGQTVYENLQTLCGTCNRKKRAKIV
jgi:hypothetical protein